MRMRMGMWICRLIKIFLYQLLWLLQFNLVIFVCVFNNEITRSPPRQHPTYGDCLEVKREYYQNSSVGPVRSNRLGLSHWDPYAVRRGGCIELYYCNMVEWFCWNSGLISTTNCFL